MSFRRRPEPTLSKIAPAPGHRRSLGSALRQARTLRRFVIHSPLSTVHRTLLEAMTVYA
jgi:hypothetical protein